VLLRIWRQLEVIAVRLLPAREREDPLWRIRARTGLASGLLFILFALLRSAQLFWLGVHSQAVLLLVTAGFVACAPVIARLTNSFAHVAHFGVGVVVLAIAGAAWSSGGAASPGLVVFMIVPLFAVFLTGTRGGAVWMAISVSLIAGFAVLDRLGLSPPVRYPLATWNLAKATAAFLLVVVVFLISTSYERARAEAFVALRKAEEARDTRAAEMGWLAASLSHEANNELAYITTDLDYVGGAIDSTDPHLASALAEARIGANRIRDIVRDVKTIAGDDPTPAADGETDVGLVLQEAVAVARSAGVNVTFDAPKDAMRAAIDAAVLERALVNVLMAGGSEAHLAVTLDPGPAVQISAERGSLPRALGIAAARRLVSGCGGDIEFAQDKKGWSAKLTLHAAPS
jgi:signal transduction histidine kinase